jgi:hypothetical protein
LGALSWCRCFDPSLYALFTSNVWSQQQLRPKTLAMVYHVCTITGRLREFSSA